MSAAQLPLYQPQPAVTYMQPAPVLQMYDSQQAPVATSLSYVPPQPVSTQPVLSYTPAPQLVRGPSFVAPPVANGQSFVAQPPGQQPVEGTLTKGMPDPASIDQQRNAYAKALDVELQKSIQSIQEKNAMEKQMLAQAAKQQKAMYELQMNQMLQGQSALVDEQRNAQLLGLQQEAMNQKIGLENQAAGLKLEYEQRKAQEEMMFKQYELQKNYYESERKMQAELGRAVGGAQTPAMPPPGGSMFAVPSVAAPVGAMPMVLPTTMQAPAMETVRSLSAAPGAPVVFEQAASGFAPPTGFASGASYAVPTQTVQAGAPVTYLQQTPSYVQQPFAVMT